MNKVLGLNCTTKTKELLEEAFGYNFKNYDKINSLNLKDKTQLFRFALINLHENPPDNKKVEKYKVHLKNLKEFDNYWIKNTK